ncbi:MAG: hypothetical protein Q9216_001282 [Gyalolechia sp. 2 TL-2023]
MPYDLKGRNVLITGASRGLGALLAEKFASEGCNVAINYNASEDRAKEVADKIQKSYNCKAVTVKGDQGILVECENTVQKSIDGLGGLDIIVSNAVSWFSPSRSAVIKQGECRAGRNLRNLVTSTLYRRRNGIRHAICWAVNCKGNLHLLRKALPTFNANPEGGVFLMTSSIAAIGTQGSAMAYSVSKAAGLQLMKCLATTQGPKVRVNAVLPGLLLTEWVSLSVKKNILEDGPG